MPIRRKLAVQVKRLRRELAEGSAGGHDLAMAARVLQRFFGLVVVACLLVSGSWAAETTRSSSDRFAVISDLPVERTAPVLRRMDMLYEAYGAWFGAELWESAGRLLLVGSEAEYRKLTGYRGERFPLAIYSPQGRTIICFVGELPVESLLPVLQHELAHCVVHQLGGADVPLWLNEGLAEYFGDALVADEQLVTGEIAPQRAEDAIFATRADLLRPIAEFTEVGLAEWKQKAAESDRYSSVWYLQAWGEVSYLLSIKGSDGRPVHQEAFVKMLRLVRAGRPAEEAFEASFGMSYAQMDEGFRGWARDLKPTQIAQAYDTAARLGGFMLGLHHYKKRVENAAEFYAESKRLMLTPRPTRPTLGIPAYRSIDRCFSGIDGRRLTNANLVLEKRAETPVPDIVYRCFEKSEVVVRFRYAGEVLGYDVMYRQTGRQ